MTISCCIQNPELLYPFLLRTDKEERDRKKKKKKRERNPMASKVLTSPHPQGE